MLILLLLGLWVGLVLGLTGAGGGILAVPALVFSRGWSVAEATPVALLAVTGSALVGAIEGCLRGIVRYRAASLMAAAGVLVTPLGIRAAHTLPGRALLVLFALTMLVVAWRLLQRAASASNPDAPCHIDPDTGRLIWTPATFLILAGIGAFTGFLTGLLGVGGGFVIVPALRKATDISMQGIVATSLLVITLVGGGGVVVSLLQGHVPAMYVALPFCMAAAAGMVAGRLLISQFQPQHIQRAFAALVMVVALGLLVQALH